MIAKTAGHVYGLQVYSPIGEPRPDLEEELTFFKKVGEKFPGNVLPELIGTNCQEVLRVIIDRVRHLDWQKPCDENKMIIINLQDSLMLFEQRAARQHDFDFLIDMMNEFPIEALTPCSRCGHIFPHSHTGDGA